jgi:flagellar FliL protein
MPAIRNNILMVLAHKTSAELLEREGKVRLADEVRRAAVRAIGMNVPEKPAEEEEANAKAKRKNKKKASEPKLPITAVHFSNFIVQ